MGLKVPQIFISVFGECFITMPISVKELEILEKEMIVKLWKKIRHHCRMIKYLDDSYLPKCLNKPDINCQLDICIFKDEIEKIVKEFYEKLGHLIFKMIGVENGNYNRTTQKED